jgi:RNA polymerase sigma-70 factor, ECF subfamily
MKKDVEEGRFFEWLKRALPDMRRRAIQLTSNGADAADLVQETCLRALTRRDLFVWQSSEGLRRWLARIMINRHFDILRRRRFETLLPALDNVPAADTSAPAWTRISDQEVADAVERLPPALRQTYRLVTVDRRSPAVIAKRLRIRPATVASRVHRARACLRKSLAIEDARPKVVQIALRSVPPGSAR